MRPVAAFLLALSCSACAGPADPALAWIRDLGSPDFRVREEAQKRLVAGGPGVDALLQEARLSRDPEVVCRAEEALRRRAPAPPPFVVTREGARFEAWQEAGVWKARALRGGQELWRRDRLDEDRDAWRIPLVMGALLSREVSMASDEPDSTEKWTLSLRVPGVLGFGLDLRTGKTVVFGLPGMRNEGPVPPFPEAEPPVLAGTGGPFHAEVSAGGRKVAVRSLGDGLGPWEVSCSDERTGRPCWSQGLPRGILPEQARAYEDERDGACLEISGSRRIVLGLATGDILSHTRGSPCP